MMTFFHLNDNNVPTTTNFARFIMIHNIMNMVRVNIAFNDI